MPTLTQRGWGRQCAVKPDKLKKECCTVTPCRFSEVLTRAKKALVQGDGTRTRIPGWMSEDAYFDHKHKEDQ